MLSADKMIHLFNKLNLHLKQQGEKGEIGIVGGAVMCLVYNARASTKDVDAVFEPTAMIRKLVAKISLEEGLPDDWLNDAAKAYIRPGFIQEDVISLSHLKVWAPDARYMLAMKCISARFDTSDGDDIKFLIKFIGLSSPQSVFEIIQDYYPKNQVESKTQFFIEELFDLGE